MVVSPFEQMAAKQQGHQVKGGESPFKAMVVQQEQQEPWWKSTLRTAAQIPQGLAATTGPGLIAGIWDLLATGDVLDPEEIERIKEISEREGIPFDEEKYRQAAATALGAIPTVSNIAKKIEEETGLPLEPKTTVQKGVRFATELAGGTPKTGVKTSEKMLSAEGQALRETAKEHGLRKFAGMEAEKSPKITPIVSEAKEKALKLELSDTTKKAIDKVIDQKIPVKKMRDMGVDLENAYETAYDAARTTAGKMGKKTIDYSNVVEWIDKEISRTKGSAPSLSKQQDVYIDLLKKEKSRLTQKRPNTGTVVSTVTPTPPKYNNFEGMVPQPPKVTTEVVKGTGDRIDLITGKKLPPALKPMTADQALNQYKNYNNNVKGIWKKPEFSGSESTVTKAYADLNDQIISAVEKANPELAKELKFANKVFHETAKLNQVEGIIAKSFKDGYDPKRLQRTLSNNRERKFLERNLGKDSVQDLEKIAKYGQKAQEKVFDHLKNPKTVKDYIEKMTPMQLALVVGYKSHVGLPIELTRGAINRIQGHLFTRNATKKSFVSFLKEASKLGNNPAPLFMASRKLNKAIIDEFGSEQELESMSEEDKD